MNPGQDECAEFTKLDARQLQQDISARLAGQPLNLNYLESCDSTNIECMQMGQHGSVVVAETQTAGRGRRGRVWVSPASENIYCSIGMNKCINAEYIGMISLLVGVSITQVLLDQGFSGIGVKWPNDIQFEGRKLGGILIETRVNAVDDFYLVIGFGLNTHLQESIVEQIDRPAIGLNQVSDKIINRQMLLSQLISAIYETVSAFQLSSIPGLIQRFAALDSYMGKQVFIISGGQTIGGIYQGLEKTGQIQIKTDAGMQKFSAAEISLRDAQHVADR